MDWKGVKNHLLPVRRTRRSIDEPFHLACHRGQYKAQGKRRRIEPLVIVRTTMTFVMDKKALAVAEDVQVMALPTSALEAKLRTLREQSQKHSQALTQKLATSQSGQNLLHIGTSLSTLPPDLHSLLTQLHPLLSATEATEKEFFDLLHKLVACANDIRILQRRIDNATDCAQLYEDLEASERDVKRDAKLRRVADAMDNDFEQGFVLGMQSRAMA